MPKSRTTLELRQWNGHCVKYVCNRSFSGQYFPSFGLNTKRYGASLSIQPEWGKIRTRKCRDMDTFHAVEKFLRKADVWSLKLFDSFILIYCNYERGDGN